MYVHPTSFGSGLVRMANAPPSPPSPVTNSPRSSRRSNSACTVGASSKSSHSVASSSALVSGGRL